MRHLLRNLGAVPASDRPITVKVRRTFARSTRPPSSSQGSLDLGGATPEESRREEEGGSVRGEEEREEEKCWEGEEGEGDERA